MTHTTHSVRGKKGAWGMIKPQTLEATGNSTNKYGKIFVVSDPKIGKTTYIACSILGALPEQEFGLVSDPSCLHIISFDEDAVGGLKSFLVDACKRPDCTAVTVWDMAAICRTAILSDGWDSTILNNILAVLQDINKRVQAKPDKVHAVLFSSFTGMGIALKHALAGRAPEGAKGSGMNMAKWDTLNSQLMTIRAEAHRDNKHAIWEGHVQSKFVVSTDGSNKSNGSEETVGVPGGEGRNWAANVGEVVRLRREAIKYPNTLIDKVYLDTRPSLDFVSGGRGFNNLAAKEYDLAKMMQKLGKNVGGYKKP